MKYLQKILLIALAFAFGTAVRAQAPPADLSRVSPFLAPKKTEDTATDKVPPGTTGPAYSLLYEMSVSPDPAMRMRAIEAWGDSEAPEALMQVMNGLLDADTRVRDIAASKLGRFGVPQVLDFVMGLLSTGDANSLNLLNSALPQMKNQLEDHLLDIFRDEAQELAIRRAAAYALGRMGSQEAALDLAKGAWHENPDFAYTCTEALYNVRDANALPTWRGLLGHENDNVRRLALYGVCTIGNREALGILREICMLQIPLDPLLQIEAARGVNAWPAQDAIPVLIEAMQANNNVSKVAALQLQERTGLDYGENPDLWIAWWQEITAPPTDAPEEAPLVGPDTAVIPSTVGTP